MSNSILQSIKNWNGETSELCRNLSFNYSLKNGQSSREFVEMLLIEVPNGPTFELKENENQYELVRIKNMSEDFVFLNK